MLFGPGNDLSGRFFGIAVFVDPASGEVATVAADRLGCLFIGKPEPAQLDGAPLELLPFIYVDSLIGDGEKGGHGVTAPGFPSFFLSESKTGCARSGSS